MQKIEVEVEVERKGERRTQAEEERKRERGEKRNRVRGGMNDSLIHLFFSSNRFYYFMHALQYSAPYCDTL